MIMQAIRRWLCRMYGHPRIDMYLAEGHQHHMDKQVCPRCRQAHFKGAQGKYFWDDDRISSVPGRWSAEIHAAASVGNVDETHPLENMTRYTAKL